MKSVFLFLCVLGASLFAQARSSSRPTFTYDLGFSTGSYSQHSYSEIQLGLNWNFLEYMIWRNSLFSRFGSEIDSAAGLDSSLRLEYRTPADERGFGINLFAGPGVRLSNSENTGVFAEAGAIVRSGGFAIGGGLKSIQYSSPGRDSNGNELSKNDTVVFLILAGGGSL